MLGVDAHRRTIARNEHEHRSWLISVSKMPYGTSKNSRNACVPFKRKQLTKVSCAQLLTIFAAANLTKCKLFTTLRTIPQENPKEKSSNNSKMTHKRGCSIPLDQHFPHDLLKYNPLKVLGNKAVCGARLKATCKPYRNRSSKGCRVLDARGGRSRHGRLTGASKRGSTPSSKCRGRFRRSEQRKNSIRLVEKMAGPLIKMTDTIKDRVYGA